MKLCLLFQPDRSLCALVLFSSLFSLFRLKIFIGVLVFSLETLLFKFSFSVRNSFIGVLRLFHSLELWGFLQIRLPDPCL